MSLPVEMQHAQRGGAPKAEVLEGVLETGVCLPALARERELLFASAETLERESALR